MSEEKDLQNKNTEAKSEEAPKAEAVNAQAKEQESPEAPKAEVAVEQKEEKKEEAKKAPVTFKKIMGIKLGMTQLFTDKGNIKSVTVVEAGPCNVLDIKTNERNGYEAVCLGFKSQEEKKLNKAELGFFKKNQVAPKKYLKEYRVDNISEFEIGQSVSLGERFEEGDYVDVQGTSKGKGFAGVMKRHNFGGLPATHGTKTKARSPGSIASRRSLGRVIPGQKMAGRMGHETVTVSKLEVVKINQDSNYIYLNGSVPGPKGTLVTVLQTTKSKKKVVIPQEGKGKKK